MTENTKICILLIHVQMKNLPKKLCTSTPPCTDTSTCSFTQLETEL